MTSILNSTNSALVESNNCTRLVKTPELGGGWCGLRTYGKDIVFSTHLYMISSWSHDVVSSDRWQPVKRFMTRTETHTIRCEVLVSSSVAERIYIFEASSNHKTWCAPLWLCIQSLEVWNGFCAALGKGVEMIVVGSRSNVMFALVTGFPLESCGCFFPWWVCQSMSYRIYKTTRYTDLQMKSLFTKQMLTGDTYRLFGHPGKSCFGLVFHLKSAVRGAETPCFQNIASNLGF